MVARMGPLKKACKKGATGQVQKNDETSNLFRNNPSQGSAGSYMQSAYTKSGHWLPATVILLFLRPSHTLQDIITNSWTAGITHLESFQSRPAGQRRKPVTGWWNPRFVLTLREMDGCKTPSRGVIQSTTTPFRLFVSSDLAPETPFWIYNGSNKVIFTKIDSNWFWNGCELGFWLNNVIQDIRHHGHQFQKDSMLGSCTMQEGVNTKRQIDQT